MSTTIRKRKEIASSLRDKAYRDAVVAAEINTTLPFQIRTMRTARGWSQSDLAERTGQAQKTISDFENPSYGKLTLTSLKRLASAFDVALVVRFVPFSELVDWAASMSHKTLAVPSFDDDKDMDTENQTETISFNVAATSNAFISTPIIMGDQFLMPTTMSVYVSSVPVVADPVSVLTACTPRKAVQSDDRAA